MTQKLPTHGFKWVKDPMQIDSNFVLNYTDGEDGYVLEVDAEYPNELHRDHNELPFMPDRMKLGKVENWYVTYTTRISMWFILER